MVRRKFVGKYRRNSDDFTVNRNVVGNSSEYTDELPTTTIVTFFIGMSSKSHRKIPTTLVSSEFRREWPTEFRRLHFFGFGRKLVSIPSQMSDDIDVPIYYGLPLVSAYMELSEEQKNNTSTGINYASASCGILPGTGKQVGKCLSMSVQVDLFKETIDKNLKKKFKTQSELSKHLAESLFMTAIGINDYSFFYNKTIDANDFATKLLHEFLIQIKCFTTRPRPLRSIYV
ncbi:hypothetical protein DY000_02057031 [Brassica cretica]|uniref:GDSL esterase/lipase n=1 Tax=Brassica cretica TaxID=69181 RepID=A0ABQ7A603_BRACR|nr:hypothetical protein DY000_02057031 [Brassica cretica]